MISLPIFTPTADSLSPNWQRNVQGTPLTPSQARCCVGSSWLYDREPTYFQPLPPTGATGLEPATSGVTGRRLPAGTRILGAFAMAKGQ